MELGKLILACIPSETRGTSSSFEFFRLSLVEWKNVSIDLVFLKPIPSLQTFLELFPRHERKWNTDHLPVVWGAHRGQWRQQGVKEMQTHKARFFSKQKKRRKVKLEPYLKQSASGDVVITCSFFRTKVENMKLIWRVHRPSLKRLKAVNYLYPVPADPCGIFWATLILSFLSPWCCNYTSPSCSPDNSSIRQLPLDALCPQAPLVMSQKYLGVYCK